MSTRLSLPLHNSLWKQWAPILLMLFAIVAVVGMEGCGGEIAVSIPGCEDCPDRCLQANSRGSCVTCLKDEHCQNENSPTRKCTTDNKCICGTDKDCPEGKSRCKGDSGCVECTDNKDCTGDNKFCAFNACVACEPRSTEACEPNDITACKKGTRTCSGGGTWNQCEGWVACKAGEKCVEEKCVPDCPEPPPCTEEGKVCSTDAETVPGKYKECKKNDKGCFELGQEESCGNREYCAKKACINFECPTPECALGDTKCVDADNMLVCEKTELGCLKWGKPKACEKDERCRLSTKRCTVCEPKDKQNCYSGSDETKNKGVCRGGEQVCDDDGSKWGDCKGEVIPSAEQCNGLDDDCDGQIDNGLTPKPCKIQTGSCATAVQRCEGAKGWEACTKEDYRKAFKEYEETETLCDGKDNDCDGKIDNGLTAPACDKKEGSCKGAVKVCDGANGWKACDDAHYKKNNPAYEAKETLCDGKDNDCNGKVDEAFATLGQNCSDGKGACKKEGKIECKQDGSGVQCSVTAGQSTTETCNGIDDDCNGSIDDGLTAPKCANTTGPCSSAVKRCDGKNGWQTCTTADYQKAFKEYETKETLCDGKDNDCDGRIDNGLTAPKCQKQLGVCAGATKACGGSKGWLTCDTARYTANNSLYQTVESKCDGKDNDCDGSADEIFTTLGQSCTVGKGICLNSGTIICKQDASGTQCSANPKPSSTEICNGKDDDCDGSVDEGTNRTCYTGSAGCTLNSNGTYTCKGACKSGIQTCSGGRYGSCSGQVTNTSERCNGKDDDCDGSTDENWSLGGTCSVGTGNCQRSGKYVCKGDGSGRECSATAGSPRSETCNGVDDDCDGGIDEGASCSRGYECRSGGCRKCSQPGDTVVFVSCSLSCRCGYSCNYLDCWTPPIGPRICAKIGCR